ncbi:GNAT family N-acetyltransferase [Mucilaginibacter sp.]
MIEIIKVQQSDITTLIAISKQTFYDAFLHLNDPADVEAYTSSAFNSDELLAELTNPFSAFYFAMLDGLAVGYIKINYSSAQTEFQNENAVEVERIYVLADHQGKKIGNQLLDFAINNAIENKLQYIWLGVWEHNTNAIRFYERNGFKVFDSHPFTLGADLQTDLLMKRVL